MKILFASVDFWPLPQSHGPSRGRADNGVTPTEFSQRVASTPAVVADIDLVETIARYQHLYQAKARVPLESRFLGVFPNLIPPAGSADPDEDQGQSSGA